LKKLINAVLLSGAFLLLGQSCLYAVCTVSTLGVNFGAYDPLNTMPADSTGSVDVRCTDTQRVEIQIGPSPNSGGFDPRQLRQSSGLDYLGYTLYTASDLATIWGDGTQGSSVVYENAKKNKVSNIPVFGRAPAGQDVYTGSYSESLLVTINF
jgi:spore coat protein U-like protein